MRLFCFAAALLAPFAAMAQTVTYSFPQPVNPDGSQIVTTRSFILNNAGPTIDGSGTLATAAASQQVFAARPTRTMLICQNPITATETLFVNFGAAASTTGGSIELAAGGVMTLLGASVPTGIVTITAATAGHRFVCKQG